MALWTTAVLIDQLVMLTLPTFYQYTGWRQRVLEVIGIIVSGLMFLYVRFARHTPETKIECQPGLRHHERGPDRCDGHLGVAAAIDGEDDPGVVDRDIAARLFDGGARQPRQDVRRGTCRRIARSTRRVAGASARRPGAVAV